jgi:hypothetical protein
VFTEPLAPLAPFVGKTWKGEFVNRPPRPPEADDRVDQLSVPLQI